MQAAVSTLPIVNLSARKSLNRKQETTSRIAGAASKSSSPCRNTVCLTLNQKRLCPLLGGPYRSSVRLHSLPEQSKPTNKTVIGQRIMSAKMLRFKQLQNQLADAHYHLNELANENRLLKSLQKRQDSALKKYEGTNAELPRIINSHHEELRVLQTKYKRLKSLHKEACDLLKDKETELQSLQSQNRHLLQLSKDRNLAEREKLQLQVSDLSHKIQQQHDTIQLLHRKLSLEGKSLKQQLHLEISKHKETQKTLQETVNKLKSLESLLDNRERKLHYSGQLPVYAKAKLGSQSLTSLRDTSSNRLRSYVKDKEHEHNVAQKDSLPLLNTSESNDDDRINQSTGSTNVSQTPNSYKTETMTSLDQVRRFRLQKMGHHSEHTIRVQDLRQKIRQQESHTSSNSKSTRCIEEFDSLKYVSDHSNLNQHETVDEPCEKVFENSNDRGIYKLSKEYNVELGYLSDDSETLNVTHEDEDEHIKNPAKKSRELHARLVNSTNDITDTAEYTKKLDNDERTDQELRNYLPSTPRCSDQMSRSKAMSLEQQRSDGDFCDSNSDLDVNEKITDAHYIKKHKKYTVKRLSLYDVEDQPDGSHESDYILHDEESNISSGLKTWIQPDNSPKFILNSQKNDSIDNERKDCVPEKIESGSDSNNEYEYSMNKYLSNGRMKAKDHILSECAEHEENIQDYYVENATADVFELQSDSNDIFLNNPDKNMSSVDNETSKLLDADIDYGDEKCANCKIEKATLSEGDFVDGTELEHSINSSVNAESGNTRHADDYTQQNHGTDGETNEKNGTSEETKMIKYNKEKLLATIKAIDDNENIEFLESPGYQKCNIMNRSQITENLFRGLPAHTKKENLIKDIFGNSNMENKRRNSCNKLH